MVNIKKKFLKNTKKKKNGSLEQYSLNYAMKMARELVHMRFMTL